MNTYEAPAITELGSVEGLTNGTGSDRGQDANYGIFAFWGYIDSSGGYGS